MNAITQKVVLNTPAPMMADPDETTWRTLWVFCAYRVVLAVFVALAFLFLNRFFNLGVVQPGAVVPTAVCFTIAPGVPPRPVDHCERMIPTCIAASHTNWRQ